MTAPAAPVAARYRLALPRRTPSGRVGERLGHGTGSSLELMDFRDYVPGDDPRHIDWRGFARTDRLQVRLYREEVAPALELIVDTSASMAVSAVKAQALRDLADAIGFWARAAGGRSRRLCCGGGEASGPLTLDGPADGLQPRVGLRPRSLRVLVSDFLHPGDPGPAIRKLAAGAAHLWVVQLLDPWELEPTAEGARTLVDCESGARADVELGAASLTRYRGRLARLCELVASAARQGGGSYARVAAASLEAMCRESLLPQGMVEPV